MAPSRWLSLFLAWTLLLQTLALASPRPLRSHAPVQSAPHNRHENHEYLVDTSQPYAEVIQERAWATDGAGISLDGIAQVYRYDIGLDRLHYFKYQMPINGPPSLGSPSLSEWLLFDGLGSTRMLVGDSGSVVDEFGYNDAFGIPYRVTANGGRAVAPPSFFLNGQQWDGGSGWGGAGTIWSGSPAFNSGGGLYFNRARYYQPGLGRFVGDDPFEGRNSSPVSLHRYLYGNHDPVTYSGPTGKFTINTFLASVAIGLKIIVVSGAALGVLAELPANAPNIGEIGISPPSIEKQIGDVTLSEFGGSAGAYLAYNLIFRRFLAPIAMKIFAKAIQQDLALLEKTITVFSGHGFHNKNTNFIRVPEGTNFTVYCKPGTSITNELGNAIETLQVPNGIYKKTFYAGDEIPNLLLDSPLLKPKLKIIPNKWVKTAPDDYLTSLSDLLQPNMGDVHWAACMTEYGEKSTYAYTTGWGQYILGGRIF